MRYVEAVAPVVVGDWAVEAFAGIHEEAEGAELFFGHAAGSGPGAGVGVGGGS